MLNLENIASSELGLTEDMMTENAARGIAEVALSAIHSGNKRLTQDTAATLPTVLIFAGNNKSGVRAVATGRHLRNHAVNALVCVLGLEREPELLEGLRQQLRIFRSFGGKVLHETEILEHVKSLAAPVDLIIDGLLGLTVSFEELRTGDQASAYKLIAWSNRSQIPVLALDLPAGFDISTGKVSVVDSAKLWMQAKYVVAMGAPKKGLLNALVASEAGEERGWQCFVCDVGLGAAAWKKAGMRVRRGVEFGREWVVGLRFQGGGGE